jgi:large subunit ribosomal protein L16
MLLPKRTKFRRQHRGRFKGVSKANTIIFGDYGIQALEPVWLTSRQIEATRRSITRYVRRTGKSGLEFSLINLLLKELLNLEWVQVKVP